MRTIAQFQTWRLVGIIFMEKNRMHSLVEHRQESKSVDCIVVLMNILSIFIGHLKGPKKFGCLYNPCNFLTTTTKTFQKTSKRSICSTDHNKCLDLSIRSLKTHIRTPCQSWLFHKYFGRFVCIDLLWAELCIRLSDCEEQCYFGFNCDLNVVNCVNVLLLVGLEIDSNTVKPYFVQKN